MTAEAEGPWRPEEDARLRDLDMSHAALAAALGRTPRAVRARIELLRRKGVLPPQTRHHMIEAAARAAHAERKAASTLRVCLRCRRDFFHIDPPRVRRLCKPCRDATAGMA
jgi:hypothetical protein